MTRRAAANLLVHLDRRAGDPLNQQVYDGIRHAILAGLMRPGTRIASSRALAADLGVSRGTVQLALEQLQAEGYLVMRKGSGTFVADELPDEAALPSPLDPAARDRPAAPRPPAVRAVAQLSRRGGALAAGRPSSRRIAGPPRAFRIGVPALDRFPVEVWSRLASRRVLSITATELDYGPPGGLHDLREAIAEHVRTARGARCEAEQIYIVGAAQRGIDLLCRLLLDPGDRALMEEPGYPAARSALVGAGAAIVPVPVDDEGLDLDAAGGGLAGARLVYVTPSHQFPLGVPMSMSRRRAVLDWASGAGAWIIEDDYDSEFRHTARPTPCLQGLDEEGRVVYTGSFSKSLFPALRLGFLIAPADLAERLIAARRCGADPQPPFLDQAVLADFMAAGHYARHLRRMRSIYRERLQALIESAERYCGGALRLRPPRSGLHAVADLCGADAAAVCDEAMARGVETMPVSAYAFGRGPVENAIILGFGAVGPEALASGMRHLAAAIEAVQRRRSAPAVRAAGG